MKKITKTTKKVVKESVGRDLVGAGRFESRKAVVAKILKKYPTPESLAAGLNKLASKLEGKAQAKVAEVASAAAACDAASYPAFVAKIAGLSKLWKYLATSAAAATMAAGAAYIVKSYIDAGKELDVERNSIDPNVIGRVKPDISFGDQAERTVRNMTGDAANVARAIKTHTPQSVKNMFSPETKAAIRNSKLVRGLKDPAKAAAKVRDYATSARDSVQGVIDNWNKKQAKQAVSDFADQQDALRGFKFS